MKISSDFKWFPFLEGKHLNYHDYFAFTGCLVSFIIAFICFVFNLIFRKISQIPQQEQQIQQHQQFTSFQPVQIHSFNIEYQPLEPQQQKIYKQKKDWRQIFERVADFFYYTSYFFLAFCPLILGAFQVIYTTTSILLIYLIYLVKLLTDYFFSAKFIFNWKSALLILIPSTLLPLFFHRTCLCFYNTEIGIQVVEGAAFNTEFTRFFQLKNNMCPEGPPCHMYASLPEDSAHGVFINVHTSKKHKRVEVWYDLEDYYNKENTLRYVKQAKMFDIQNSEHRAQRNVHSALLNNLQADTRYVISVKYDQYNKTQFYKTLPEKNSNITMINAGDIGTTKNRSTTFNQLLIEQNINPDIFVVGGDIAYDDNFNSCFYTWDFYLSSIERIFALKNNTIFPFIWGIGNHDAGVNSLPIVKVNKTKTSFFSYFPQHVDEVDGDVPDIEKRKSYFMHSFGNNIYFSLDSGYIERYEEQAKFMKQKLDQYKGKFKFANYHQPLYGTCHNDTDQDSEPIKKGLQKWVPIFDQYKFITVYENHVHTFKRTYPLKGGMKNENGTVYLGDGAYGAIPLTKLDCDINYDEQEYLAKANLTNNFWVSQIFEDRIEHRAYNTEKVVFDSYIQNGIYYLEND